MSICFPRLLLMIYLALVSNIVNIYPSVSADLKCPDATKANNRGHFGPFDYRDPSARNGTPSNPSPLELVDSAHFTPEVATLTRGNSSTIIEQDINYTLLSFPNHHRALQTLADFGLRKKSSTSQFLTYTIPCYFIRAKHFAPTDGMVDAVYAYYLANLNQKDMAHQEAEEALKKANNNPRVYYHTGLAYYYLGEYEKAKECSNQAKKLGSKAVGLETLLSQVSSKSAISK